MGTRRRARPHPRADSNQKQGRALEPDCGGPGQPSPGLCVVVTISSGRQGGQRSEALEATMRMPMVPWIRKQNSRERFQSLNPVHVELSN